MVNSVKLVDIVIICIVVLLFNFLYIQRVTEGIEKKLNDITIHISKQTDMITQNINQKTNDISIHVDKQSNVINSAKTQLFHDIQKDSVMDRRMSIATFIIIIIICVGIILSGMIQCILIDRLSDVVKSKFKK